MGEVQAQIFNDPFTAKRQVIACPAGKNIFDILKFCGVKDRHLNGLIVELSLPKFLSPIIIDRQKWHLITPKSGVIINILPMPAGGGGDGGKNPLQMILSVAIMAASIYFPPLVAEMYFTAGTFAFTAAAVTVGVGITIAGSLAINAIVSPKMRNTGGLKTQTGAQVSPSSAITGIQNQANPYGEIPITFGRNKIFPVHYAKPYSEVVGGKRYHRYLFCFGQGPCQLSGHRIGTSGLSKFDEVETEIRQGYSNDKKISLYSNTVFEERFTIALKYGKAVILETSHQTDEFAVDVGFHGLVEFGSDEKGKNIRLQNSVDIKFSYRRHGENRWISPNGVETITAATVKSYYKSYRQRTGSQGKWQIKIERLTADNKKFKIHNNCSIVAVKSFKYSSPIPKKGLCLVAMRILETGQLHGQIEKYSAIAERLIPVYNSNSKKWSAPKINHHPAWVAVALIKNRDYKTPAHDDQIDLDIFSHWAKSRPNDKCSIVLNGGTLSNALVEIMSAGMASPALIDGKLTPIIDEPKQISVMHFNPKNSWGYSGRKIFVRFPDAIRASFINPKIDYKEDNPLIWLDGKNAITHPNPLIEEMEFPATRDFLAVKKQVIHYYRVAKFRQETHVFQTNIRALRCQKGDLINFSHDVPMIGRQFEYGKITGVKVVKGNIIELYLDEMVIHETGKKYAIELRGKDGRYLYKNVKNNGKESRTVVLEEPLSADLIERDDEYVFGEAEQVSIKLIITDIKNSKDLTAKITATDYAPEIWDAGEISKDYRPVVTWPVHPDITRPAPPIVDHIYSDEPALIRLPDGSVQPSIMIKLAPPAGDILNLGEIQAEIRPALSGENWQRILEHDTTVFDVQIQPVEVLETYEIRLRYTLKSGIPGFWRELPHHKVIGGSTPPADPTGLIVEKIPNDMRRYRVQYGDRAIDFAGFEFRWHLGVNYNFDTAIKIHPNSKYFTSDIFEAASFAGRTFTILVKAVDLFNNLSVNAAFSVVKLGDYIADHIADEIDFAADEYQGKKIGALEVKNGLRAFAKGSFYAAGDQPFYTDPDAPLFSGFEAMSYFTNFKFNRRGFLQILGEFSTGAKVEYRILGDAPFYRNPQLPLYINPAAPIFSMSTWLDWHGEFEIEANSHFQLKITCPAGNIQGQISNLKARLRLELSVTNFDDIIIEESGTRLTPKIKWDEIINVSLSLQQADGFNAVNAYIANKNAKLGALVICHDADGHRARGLIDATIQGIASE